MAKKTSIEMSRYIDGRYKEYLRSSFRFGDTLLQSNFEDILEKESLFKGPYLDLILPYRRGSSIQSLIDEGMICKSFSCLGLDKIKFKRPLYWHQEQAIRRIMAGRNAIITTGTSSGKTECFLYPILNDLLQDIEEGVKGSGIRALFLYPMNALVNDQIDRIREILRTCPDITYGFFTGDTKETISSNERIKYGEENGVIIPDNELLSRKEIRENPPHLLFTNYSMLEYMMIRPDDYSIFSPGKLAHWKYVVLDEAHTYHGSLGIELSLLLRRVTGLAIKKPRFILTSATLGKEGESEKDIIDFAKKLTSASYEVKDIIFSRRIPLSSTVGYTVEGSDYVFLKQNLDKPDALMAIVQKYRDISSLDSKEAIFDLLAADRNVHMLYSILKDGSKPVEEIIGLMNCGISETEFIAFVDVINYAERDGIELFNLKYHSFVRPLSGAYISLNDMSSLTLTKTTMLKGMRAFEIGNCKYCNAPYIIGRIQYNDADQLNYLLQNSEVDIYENYGNIQSTTIDYFLFENDISEEADTSVLEEYLVCAKCGEIHPAQNLNARKCACEDVHRKRIYRVSQKQGKDAEPEVYNNINQCPCCGKHSKSGVVKTLNIGKDEGTALIAQSLYEAIDTGAETKTLKKNRLSLRVGKKQENTQENKPDAKQFLAFSDSRQQASFAAVFFDATHVRMLQKRLIWKVIEDQNYRDLTVDELAAFLDSEVKGGKLFQNGLSPTKNAWLAILRDLLKIDGDYDSEGVGLYYFDLDLSDVMDCIDEEDIEEEFGQYGLTKADFETLIQVVLGVFKITPAINYVKSTLTNEEKMEGLEYRRFDNYVMFNCDKTTPGIRSFLPIKGGENMVVRYVMKACNCNQEIAKGILDVIFNNLLVGLNTLHGATPVFIKHSTKEAYQIDASRYIVKNYKTSKFYRCSKCGRLTPYNIHNVCVHDRCKGTLQEIDPDKVLGSNYYRKQYQKKKIEGIVIKEHTAQLERKKAKQYQRDFKNKEINILSCSTTFEMGIDLGSLETVFMRNVPPTPANYVQRAGRAGRGKGSTAYILTYCGTGSHDYTYFSAPSKMISGVIRPPFFDVQNKKIIDRHIMAICLGFFFRKYPEYYKTIDKIVFGDGVEKIKQYLSGHPADLNQYITERVLPEGVYNSYHDFRWLSQLESDNQKLQYFVETIREMAKEYEDAKTAALNEEKYSEADYYTKQIENLHKERMIDSLSKYCVIPKYGFPVDVVELQIYEKGVLNQNYDLNRDLKIAISEYAPDSEVIVDGKKYTSRFITLPKASPFRKHYFCTCPACKKINVYLSDRSIKECKYCGNELSNVVTDYYIEPIYGFKTGKNKESSRMKPKRTYAGEVSYLGRQEVDRDNVLMLGAAMSVYSQSEEELLVVNRSGFYMCPVCGFSYKAANGSKLPQQMKTHENFREFKCQCEDTDYVRIGHRFKTDIARFSIPSLSTFDKTGYSRALTFMYAFLEGISNALGIERTDIDGLVETNLETASFDLLLYDNVPGGAGHVKRLVQKETILSSLKAAHEKVSQHCCEGNTSCYNCLRNYYNQSYHNKLKRDYAKEQVELLLREIR